MSGLAIAEVATEVGVNERTARRRVAQADAYKKLPEPMRAEVDTGERTVQQAVRGETPADAARVSRVFGTVVATLPLGF